MKKIAYVALALVIILFIVSCYSEETDDYEHDCRSSFEAEFDYYERMCDEFGLLTYDMVHKPEEWRNYVQNDIYHQDYFCPKFNRNDDYLYSASGFLCSKCDVCVPLQDDDYRFLDMESHIVHKSKRCLVLDTDDFIHTTKNYEFSSEESALKNGFSLCPDCCK